MFKRIIYIGISILLLSCDTDDSEPAGTEPITPVIEALIEGSIKETFEVGDRIGLFPVEYVDGIPGILGDVRNPLNIPYQFDGQYWSAAQGDDLVLENNIIDLYAYYPYDPEISLGAGKTNLRAYPYDLSGNQSDKETDFLWSKVTAITQSENSAQLVFNHVFSRFIINLNYSNSDPADASLEIYNMMPSVTINLETGTVTRTDEREEIRPILMAEPEAGFDLTYSAIVPPGSIPKGTPIFSMANGNDTSLFYLSSDEDFLAGYTYTFNIIIGNLETGSLNPPLISGSK